MTRTDQYNDLKIYHALVELKQTLSEKEYITQGRELAKLYKSRGSRAGTLKAIDLLEKSLTAKTK